MKTLWDEFQSYFEKNYYASTLVSLLSWDQEVMMPPNGGKTRGGQLAFAQALLHERLNAPRYLELLENLSQQNNALTPTQQASVRVQLRKVRRARRIPQSLVEEMARTEVHAHSVWVDARKQSNFSLFSPVLEKVLALKIQLAKCLQEGQQSPYEALVQEFDPDFSLGFLKDIFSGLRQEMVPLVDKIVEQNRLRSLSPEKLKSLSCDLETQRRLSEFALKFIHFDLESGRLDEAVHPFCNGWLNDTRLTTRYREDDWTNSLYSVLHEGGHGLYEQGMGRGLGLSPLMEAPGMGIHESQSRFWENVIGRSQLFCEVFLPRVQQSFGLSPGLTPHELYQHVNKVQRSYIRVEADEATYNLHILLRFEIEEALFSGALQVKDLREAWNEKVESILHLPLPSDAEGVLQDVHWAWGCFGYFPSYAIGNLMGAQLAQTLKRSVDVESSLRKGQLAPVKEWLFENVHRFGHETPSLARIEKATGQVLSTRPFLDYLKQKFL